MCSRRRETELANALQDFRSISRVQRSVTVFAGVCTEPSIRTVDLSICPSKFPKAQATLLSGRSNRLVLE